MNRRPNQSRTGYDSFTPSHAARFTASTPDAHFFEQRKKKSTGMRIFLALLFLLAALLVLNLISNQFVHIEKLEVPVRGLSEIFDGYTILHLSDLKGDSFGRHQQLFALSLKNTHFDTVLITGDMISPDGDAGAFYELLDQLHEINPAAPVYMIAGDSDPTPASLTYAGGGSPFAPWVLGAQQRHAQLLDAPQAIRREGQTLWLTSSTHLNLDLDTMQHRFEEQYAHSRTSGDRYEAELAIHNLKWLEETRAARAEITDPDILITLMHTPPTAEELQSARSAASSRPSIFCSAGIIWAA